jgi:hypothetical protein
MRTTTSLRVSCFCASSLMINKHLSHILGIECLLLLHRSTIFHFHHKPSTSRSLLKDLSHHIMVSLLLMFTKCLPFLTSCADTLFSFISAMALSLSLQDLLCMPLIKTRLVCASSTISQKVSFFTFSDFLTHRKQQNNSGLPSLDFSTSNCTFYTFSSFLLLISLHSIAQAAHDNLFRQQDLQQPFFDKKHIKKHLSRQKAHQKPLLLTKKHRNHRQSIFSFFFFIKLISFSTKHEVSALSGHVPISCLFPSHPLTLKRFRFRGRAGILLGIFSIFESFVSHICCSGKMPALCHQRSCHLSQTAKQNRSQITALKRDQQSATLHFSQHNKANITSEGLPLAQHQLHQPCRSTRTETQKVHRNQLLSLRKRNPEQSTGIALVLFALFRHCIRSLFLVFFWAWQQISASSSHCKKMENLGKAPKQAI